jgi:hypothetical protein
VGVLMRKWLAGWLSRAGGALVAFADRLYPPPEFQRPIGVYDVMALQEASRRESRGWDNW